MTGDTQAYGRALGVCFVGLALHVVMTVGLAIHAALSPIVQPHLVLAVYAAMGIPVWGVLALLFDFHRRERLESIEQARLEAEGASTAFEESAADLNVSARRLAGVQRYLLPIVSLSVASVLISVGLVRLLMVDASPDLDALAEEGRGGGGWAVSLGLGVAAIGFIFARYVSGMAKQKVWRALRGGAAWGVGTALFGLAIGVGYLTEMLLGQDIVLEALVVVFPAALVVLGGEIVLNFLLDLYRPRLTGEDPHAAFDSRLLGLLAAPDKIAENVGEALNYQLGVRVTDTWFYELIRRWWLALVALCFLVGWLMTSLVVIEPHQRGLIVTNGAIRMTEEGSAVEVGPGLHVKWPWPISRVAIPEFATLDGDGDPVVQRTATGIRTVNLGTNPPSETARAILWTNDHTAEEIFTLVQPTTVRSAITDTGLLPPDLVAAVGESAGADAAGGTAEPDASEVTDGLPGDREAEDDAATDLSLVAIESPMTWAVGDLLAYEVLAVPGDRERFIKAMGERALLLYAGGKSIDGVLAGDRRAFVAGLEAEIEDSMRRLSALTLRAQLDESAAAAMLGGGGAAPLAVRVLNVGTGNVHPPREVADSFERVVQAAQNVQSRIEEAETQKIRILSAVAGSVQRSAAISEALEETELLRRRGEGAEEISLREQMVREMIEGAGGEAGSLLLNASAERWQLQMGERGRAELYRAQLASYLAAPSVFRSQAYFDALEEVMRDTRVFWVSSKLEDALTVLDLNTEQATNVFDPNVGEELQ